MFYRDRIFAYFRQRDRGWILSLFAAVCLVYLPFLGNPFIFDDLNFFTGDVPQHYAHALFQFDMRWLPYASLGWTYAIFSAVYTHFYHLGNLLLHAATSIALFYLLRQLTAAAIPDSKSVPSLVWGAWFGALIFAVHPVAVYATGYVIQRSILTATLFVMLMQLAYLRGLLTGQRRWLALTVAAYFLAVFSKEHSVLAPLLLAVETVLLRAEIKTSARSLWITWAALFAVAVQIVLLAKGVIGTPYETGAAALFEQQDIVASTPMLHLLSMMTQAGLFFKYLLLLIVPNPAWMSIDMREPFVSSLAEWQGWLGALGFMAYGAWGFWLLLRPRWAGLVGLALLYPWLLFVLEFSSIRVQEVFVLYRSYLWLPGLMLFIPVLLAKWPGKRSLLILGVTVLLLLPLAWNRLWVFGDNYRLWNDAVRLLTDERAAGAGRIFYNRGISASPDKKPGEAIADLERAVKLSPQLAPVHFVLGVEYFNALRYQDAMAQFDETIKLNPGNGQAYYAKGITLKRLHDDKQAIKYMEKSCELKNTAACMILGLGKSNK